MKLLGITLIIMAVVFLAGCDTAKPVRADSAYAQHQKALDLCGQTPNTDNCMETVTGAKLKARVHA